MVSHLIILLAYFPLQYHQLWADIASSEERPGCKVRHAVCVTCGHRVRAQGPGSKESTHFSANT